MLISRGGKKDRKKHELPDKGYLNIPGQSEKRGTSRVNKLEAKIIAKWIYSRTEKLENEYGKVIHEILAVVTPYKTHVFLIKKELLNINKSYRKMTVGTVHSLQGAEREIVIFSTVLGTKDSRTFLNSQYNMLNVAVSRTKHSFLVFGNTNILNALENNPLGNLKKWLIEENDAELSNKIVYDSEDFYNGQIMRINTLKGHRAILKRAFEVAENQVVIVSPFISIYAIKADNLDRLINKKNQERIKTVVVTDSNLDTKDGSLKSSSSQGRELCRLVVLKLGL